MLTKNCDRRDWDDVTALKPSMRPYYLSCNYAFSISVIHRRKPGNAHGTVCMWHSFRFRSVFTCLHKKKQRLKTKRSQKTAFSPGSVFGRFSVDDRQTQWYKQTTKSDTRISFNFLIILKNRDNKNLVWFATTFRSYLRRYYMKFTKMDWELH